MRIIIVGAGEVGSNLARIFLNEGQDVVIIDNNPEKISSLMELMDVQAMVGHGSHPDVLEAAGAENCNMLVAVTSSDEVNMVACQIAYSIFGVQTKIARVRDEAYRRVTADRLYNQDNMPVDVTISPGLEVANAITRALTVPGAFEVEDYLNGKLQLVGVRAKSGAPCLGEKLFNIEKKHATTRIAAIYRGDRLLIPSGDDHIENNDDVYLVSMRENIPEMMEYLGYNDRENKDVFIIGGGHIGYNICRILEVMGYRPKVLESDKSRAQWLAGRLNKTTVLHGDALDKTILEQELISQMGAVITVTSDDATNMLASRLISEMGGTNIITLVNKASFVPLVANLGLEKVISPGDITASRILKHLRVGQVHSIHALKDGLGEILEARVTSDSPLVGVHLKDLELPSGMRLCAVMSQNKAISMDSETLIHAGDTVILVAREDLIHKTEGLL